MTYSAILIDLATITLPVTFGALALWLVETFDE